MLREEMKKIWRPGVLAALILLGGVFYWMFLAFSIDHFPNGPYQEGLFRIASDMAGDYGTSLDQNEFEEFASSLSGLEAEAGEYLRNYPLAREYGMTGYTGFRAFFETAAGEISQYSGDRSDPAQKKYEDAQLIANYLTGGETDNVHGRITAVEEYIRQYEAFWENAAVRLADDTGTEREYENAKVLFFGGDEAWRNILPWEVTEATGTYFSYLLVWMSASLCILLSPVLVRDKLCKMRPLQWSARRGRSVLNSQLAAAMLSAFLLTTANLLLFGGLFLTNGTLAFAACKMFSFMAGGYSWVNWSYGVWCCALVAICYLVSFGVAGIVFFLSNYSGNYIAMLLKLIPVFAIAVMLATRLVYYAFYYNNALYGLTGIPMTELLSAAVILVIGAVLSLLSARREKKKDLLTA